MERRIWSWWEWIVGLSSSIFLKLHLKDTGMAILSPTVNSDEGPRLETLDYTIRIGSTPTFSYFDLYLYSAYAAHYVYNSLFRVHWSPVILRGQWCTRQQAMLCEVTKFWTHLSETTRRRKTIFLLKLFIICWYSKIFNLELSLRSNEAKGYCVKYLFKIYGQASWNMEGFINIF